MYDSINKDEDESYGNQDGYDDEYDNEAVGNLDEEEHKESGIK